jgi:hypothetical protein
MSTRIEEVGLQRLERYSVYAVEGGSQSVSMPWRGSCSLFKANRCSVSGRFYP